MEGDGLQASIATITPATYTSFPFFCDFWCIAHEIAAVFYASQEPVSKTVPLAFAESKYQRLLQWAERLPSHLARSDSMTHDVTEMQ